MATGDIHLNDIGTTFEMTVRDENRSIVDLSLASAFVIQFARPDGTKPAPKTGTLSTDGKDGKVQYITVDGDLNKTGNWKVQAKVIIGAASYSSDIHDFEVHKNL